MIESKRPPLSAKSPGQAPVVESLESRQLFSAHPASAPPVDADGLSVVSLSRVKDYSYVQADLSAPAALDAVANSGYDMLVVDPTATYKSSSTFNMAAMVSQLHQADPGRVVLAYLNIGEAGDFRTYWQNNWKAPTTTHHGSPSFLLAPDPYGYAGSYPVAYWSAAWQKIYLGKNGVISQLMKAGFDGVALDWVSGFSLTSVEAAAKHGGVNPAKAMVNFIGKVRAEVKSYDSAADVVGINCNTLAQADPALLEVVDAGIFADTWFYGTPGSAWGDPAGGDLPTNTSTTTSLIDSYQLFKSDGKPVFTLDFALQSTDADLVYAESSELGFVPLVSQVALSQTTTTPPPWLSVTTASANELTE